ncbi:hypothetical protein SAMN00808754_2721 [Thermanaeromonas toyohensis ToBE]|uniref:Uncharacterized protein n=1 Tax=Thermanaeromonas toyohensis ToBE TaxID=698762 RepID=A0A1W1W0M0_9FIRM|nr:hypothetical protein [Thermanaeromonas toyohensis]SMB99063.1 hypothetical protein SAMN00808754_2721 [Thermanaeromonas toyohensis ToBE]
MAYAKIDAGICGFITEVEVIAHDIMQAKVKINTTCPNIQKIAAELTEVNPLEEIGNKNEGSRIREFFQRYSPHAACPVPSGLVKAIEVAAGLALPRDAHIYVSR